jgi:HTH-type transcriptional regulator/antitoxin HipB
MDATSQPIRLSSQLRQHLRALRESRGLTQAQLGRLLGVKQARVAEIESNPGAVSVDQLIRVFAVLGSTLYLSNAGVPGRAGAQRPAAKSVRQKTAANVPPPTRRSRRAKTTPQADAKLDPTRASTAPRRTSLTSLPKKGTW